MSRRLLTGLLALVLALVVGGVWYVSADSGEAVAGPARIVPGAMPGGQAAAPERSGDLASQEPGARTSEAPREAAVDEVGGDGVASVRRGRWDRPRDAVWVSGQVVMPPGAPFDEEIVVEAEGAAFPSDPDGRRRYRAKCDENGNFRVAFAPRTRYGRIGLVARYVYLDERYKVELFDPANHSGLRIEPKLGGLAVVRVLPPRSAAFSDDPLKGVTVVSPDRGLGGEDKDGWWTGREGEWEVGGLVPEKEYTLIARSPLWADGRTSGVEVTAGQVVTVDVSLSIGAQLAGTVVDELGNLVTTAEVEAMTPEMAAASNMPMRGGRGDALAEPVEARGGQFELRGIPPGELVLVGRAGGYLEGKLELGELSDGSERRGLTVRLDSGGKVSGVVRWPWGDLAEGAVVRVVQGGRLGGRFKMERLKGEVKVGADGFFAFSGLDPDSECSVTASAIHPDERPDPNSRVSLLQARKTPRWVASQTELMPGAPPIDLELSKGDVLSGKVVDDTGEPVKHFAVLASPAGSTLLSSSSRRPVRGRFKSEEGEFDLKGVQPGDWEVKVSAGGHTDSERRSLTVPYGRDLTFTLARTGSVSGVVYGPDGDLAPGATVWAEHGGGQSASTQADQEGLYELGKLYPGEVTLFADSDAGARSNPVVLAIASAQEREDVALRVQPGATVVVEVHPEAGEREGRRVSLSSQRSEDITFGPGMRRTNESGRTDADGEAEFTGLDSGTYVVELSPEENASWNGDRSEWLLRTANRKKGEVTVAAGGVAVVVLGGPQPGQVTVRGTITSGGEPVKKGLVTATDLEKSEERPSAATNAEDDGTYSLTLDHGGRWRFAVRYEQGSWSSFVVDVPETSEYTLDFEIPETRIEGLVTGPDGAPVPEMAVSLVDEASDGRRNDWFAQKRTTTDAEGRYRFENLSPGTYHLRCGGGDGGFGFLREADIDYGRVLEVVQVGEDAGTIERDLRLPRAGEVFGNVRNAAGQPVPGARITVADEGGRSLSQFQFHRSGPDGSFTYDGVGPGTYLVSASRGGATSEAERIKVYEGGRAEVQLTVPDE